MPPRRNGIFGRRQQTNLLSLLFPQEANTSLLSLFSGQPSRRSGLFWSSSRSMPNVGGLTDIINNTQKAIEVVQKTAPLVEQAKQYGPLIKNLPTMYKMFKVINSSPGTTKSEPESESSSTKLVSKENSEEPQEQVKIERIETRSNEILEKESLPMFFMPKTRA